jgi:hypothetical protein
MTAITATTSNQTWDGLFGTDNSMETEHQGTDHVVDVCVNVTIE